MRVRGFLDGASRRRVKGWAHDLDSPDTPLSLIITVNGVLAARVIANLFRTDLQKVDGVGRLSFEFDFAQPLSPLERHVIEVRGEIDGTPLRGSPSVIEPVTAFNDETRRSMSNLLVSFETDEDAEERLAFLVEQTDLVVRTRKTMLAASHPREEQYKVRGMVARSPAAAPRALVIDDKVPVIARDAGSVAIVSHVQSLARCGYEVSFVGAKLGREAQCAALGEVSVFARPWFGSVEEVLSSQAGSFDIVYLHRCHTAAAYAQLVRTYQPAARVICSVADLASLRLRRQAERERRPELITLSRRQAALELMACRLSDAVITHSTVEADLIRRHLRTTDVHVVPFGVSARPTLTPFASRAGLAFIGGYDHTPNVDAAFWLAGQIMPEVAALDADIKCLLVGSAMPRHVRALGSETIEPLGAVDDLAFVFDRVRLTVAPLNFGAGVKGKVLESLAAGIPCVCTPVAAEGMDLPDPLSQLVAGEPGAIAALILRLHTDAAFNAACAEAGKVYIAARNSPDAIDAAMRPAIGPAPSAMPQADAQATRSA